MYQPFDFTEHVTENDKIVYHFVVLDGGRVKLTQIEMSSRRNSRCRIWQTQTWRSNGHKDFTPTHVPPHVVSAAIEHFKKSIHWIAPEF